MGYMHISNLYKNARVLDFRRCYAMEKVHGTSARVQWKGNKIIFHAGGSKHETFTKIFSESELQKSFEEHFKDVDVVVYGEAYGGSIMRMGETYGKEQSFIAFEVQIGDAWLTVPNAEDVTKKLGLEFVPYNEVDAHVESLNFQRDLPSVVATRRGCGDAKTREGIVIRPLNEYVDNRGDRVIVKHKTEAFMETATKREVTPERLGVLTEANEVAEEWVTKMRLQHIIGKFSEELTIKDTGRIIKLMQEDVCREGKGEIVESKEVRTAIGKKTVQIFKENLGMVI